MQKLKFLTLFSSIVCLLGALSGVQSFRLSSETVSGITSTSTAVSYYSNFDTRIYALLSAIVFAAFALGIQKRVRITWKLGFPLFLWIYISTVIGGIFSTIVAARNAAQPINFSTVWLPASILTIIGAGILIRGCYWWKRQQGYFTNPNWDGSTETAFIPQWVKSAMLFLVLIILMGILILTFAHH